MPKNEGKINEEQLLKLIDTFAKKGLNYRIAFKLCKVNKLLDLSIIQYNYLLCILLEKRDIE